MVSTKNRRFESQGRQSSLVYVASIHLAALRYGRGYDSLPFLPSVNRLVRHMRVSTRF